MLTKYTILLLILMPLSILSEIIVSYTNTKIFILVESSKLIEVKPFSVYDCGSNYLDFVLTGSYFYGRKVLCIKSEYQLNGVYAFLDDVKDGFTLLRRNNKMFYVPTSFRMLKDHWPDRSFKLSTRNNRHCISDSIIDTMLYQLYLLDSLKQDRDMRIDNCVCKRTIYFNSTHYCCNQGAYFCFTTIPSTHCYDLQSEDWKAYHDSDWITEIVEIFLRKLRSWFSSAYSDMLNFIEIEIIKFFNWMLNKIEVLIDYLIVRCVELNETFRMLEYFLLSFYLTYKSGNSFMFLFAYVLIAFTVGFRR